MIDDMINGGIFGMIRSGKTTLARKLAWHFWKTKGQRSIYFDPKRDPARNWFPDCTTIFYDEAPFWDAAWKGTGLVVIADEAAVSIARERELTPVFTMMNGRHHRFIVVGHSGTDLLPAMRQQIDYLFLFRQAQEAADMWRKEFPDEQKLVMEATRLNQFEYLLCRKYVSPEKFYLTKNGKLQVWKMRGAS